MTLNRNGKLIRWAYCFSEDSPPKRVSLCSFFWRAFICVPLVWMFIMSLTLGALFFFIKYTIITKGFLLFLVLLVIGLVYLGETYDGTDQSSLTNRAYNKISNTIFVQGIKTIKGKFCPIIEVK